TVGLVQPRGQHGGLGGARYGLNRQQVGAARGQQRQALAVKPHEFSLADTIVAGIFGAVGQHGPVRADAGGRERTVVGAAMVATGRQRKIDGTLHQGAGAIVVDAGSGEAFKARLVGGADHDICPGLEVVVVHGADRVRVVGEHRGRPQGRSEVAAAPPEIRGESAVDQGLTASREHPLPGARAQGAAPGRPNAASSVGSTSAIRNAEMAMARPENAPISSLTWKARAVPMPWAVEPMATPATASSRMPSERSSGTPITAPRIPVATTSTAVSDGSPP